MSSTPSIGVIAVFLYKRAPVIVSKESATERIRAPNGMTFPFNPAGYPDPSQRSWWCRTNGATSASAECCAIISAPISGCRRMISHSSSLRGPGLLSMSSRTPIFPRSCRDPAVRIKSTSRSPNSSCSPRRPAMSATRIECDSVYLSRASSA